MFVLPVAVMGLHRMRGVRVQGAPRFREQSAIRGFTGERMLEHVFDVRKGRTLVDEFGVLQRSENLLKPLFRK